MSCNNFLAYYSSYYNCQNNCNPYYSRKCYSNCDPCQTVCNPCQTVCNPCQQQCFPCPQTFCPNVSYINNATTSTTVVSGGVDIPAGTIIPTGSTTVPAGTVTVISGFTGTPSTNFGGVISNNGFFTIPIAGKYIITANVCFATTAGITPGDFRELYIYRVDASTGIVSLLAADSRPPVLGNNTCINISTNADLGTGDRIFIAARQVTSGGTSVTTVVGSRIAITRL